MAIPSSLVGSSTEAFVHEVDARWLMAYAASLGDVGPRYLDTRAVEGIVAHPLFPVCPEWPVVLAVRDLAAGAGTPLDELRRGVHATHDLHLHRPIRPGDVLSTVARVVAVEARPPGAYLLMRLDSVDAAGHPVSTTWQGSLYLGTAVDGVERRVEDAPSLPEALAGAGDRDRMDGRTDGNWTLAPVPLDAGAAHVYTECARIWNPIHTDPVAAQRAGLPAIILHGTATHARAVSEVVSRYAGGDPTRVRRIGGRFGGMVLLPSTITVATRRVSPTVVAVAVRSEEGGPALRDAFVELAP
jgi:acyl dehydratase